jgi:hypothetical protein
LPVEPEGTIQKLTTEQPEQPEENKKNVGGGSGKTLFGNRIKH